MGVRTEVVFKPLILGELDNPVFIIGSNPSRKSNSGTAWVGSKSARFLTNCLEGLENIYLSNVCQHQDMTPGRIQSGLKVLENAVTKYRPRKIICLGNFANFYVQGLSLKIDTVMLLHPSYIVRFKSNRRKSYRRKLRKEIV